MATSNANELPSIQAQAYSGKKRLKKNQNLREETPSLKINLSTVLNPEENLKGTPVKMEYHISPLVSDNITKKVAVILVKDFESKYK